MNIFEISRRQVEERLRAFGIEEARQESVLILEFVSGLKQTDQIISDLSELEAAWQAEIERIVEERRLRVPIQYILARADFMGMVLNVRPGVLIPRPDTETLVRVAIALARQTGAQIAEIGVGSGAVAIALLKSLPEANLFGCDISRDAVSLTDENARKEGVSERLRLVEGDWRQVLPDGLDLIVSNPPYVPASEKSSLPPEIAMYEPPAALFDEDGDGLGFFRAFASMLPEKLKAKSGWLALEMGDGQAEAVWHIFAKAGWRQLSIHEDVNGCARVFSARLPV